MSIYERYAPFYDHSGQVRFALLVKMYLQDLLIRHSVPGRRMLDLACGTGTLAIEFAAEGWDVVGLDASPAMLAQASAKADSDLLGQARFIAGDLRRADADLPVAAFDLITCTYDSLNYLRSSAELHACFSAVARLLAPGGLFIGDMNTPYFLAHDWAVCEVRELPGYVQIERSSYDPAVAEVTMALTGFVGDDDAGYDRFDEIHIERGYPPDQIADLVHAAGLVVEAHYDAFSSEPPGPQSQRIFWLARRSIGSAVSAPFDRPPEHP
ncbi:MAG: class I SAM-dependent methyltransferase [Oscillochloris sp.]|nr:class I SAM-dependent methyltransferase [Oscillochloris sp.]